MLMIIRGLPGSGKTTLAEKFSHNEMDMAWRHFEADMYFTGKNGVYAFDKAKLGAAHAWCQKSVMNALLMNRNVIVANTFTTLSEIEPYITMAKELQADVKIIECRGQFTSVHDVPHDAMQAMRARYVSNDALKAALNDASISFEKY